MDFGQLLRAYCRRYFGVTQFALGVTGTEIFAADFFVFGALLEGTIVVGGMRHP